MSSFLFKLRRSSISIFIKFICRIWGPLLLFSFPKGKVGGPGNLLRSRFMWPFSLRIFQNFLIHLFRNPVFRPGFPSFFQHGQPEGLRRGRHSVLCWFGTIFGQVTFLFRRSSSSYVFPSFSHGGLDTRDYAGDVRAGSRGLGPDYARLIRASGQHSGSWWSPSSPSSGGALRGVYGKSLTGVGVSSRWSRTAWCCGPSSSGGGDADDWIPTSHALSEVWGLLLGYPAPGPGVRIRMPLPASCYVPPPSPWVWPGWGPAVAVTRVRGPPPTTPTTGPPGLPGPTALPLGPPAVGPAPVPPPSTALKNTSPTPLRFRGFFPGATPPFIPTAPSSSVNIAAPPQMPQDAGTLPQGPTPEMVKGWKEELMEDMKNHWKQFIGDAPPQSTVDPAVTHENMGPDALRQLSPSDDQEVSRAQHKTGSKWAGSDSRRHSGSRERSSSDRHRARVRRPPTSPDSSSPTRHRSPPAKRSRWDWRKMSNDSSSSEGRQRSTRPRRPWSSRSPGRRRRDSSHSPSPHRRYRSSPAPSRWSSGAGMTKRLAGVPPRRHSGGHPLIIDGPFNHPGAVTYHLRPAPGALIIACPLHPLGRFHL